MEHLEKEKIEHERALVKRELREKQGNLMKKVYGGSAIVNELSSEQQIG